jgi:hypothetical protein
MLSTLKIVIDWLINELIEKNVLNYFVPSSTNMGFSVSHLKKEFVDCRC